MSWRKVVYRNQMTGTEVAAKLQVDAEKQCKAADLAPREKAFGFHLGILSLFWRTILIRQQTSIHKRIDRRRDTRLLPIAHHGPVDAFDLKGLAFL